MQGSWQMTAYRIQLAVSAKCDDSAVPASVLFVSYLAVVPVALAPADL